MPWVGLQCVIVVFPDHTHLLFGFKTLLQQCISEPVFYDGVVIYEKKSLECLLKQLKHHQSYKIVGYIMDIMWQTACLVITPITVYSHVFVL